MRRRVNLVAAACAALVLAIAWAPAAPAATDVQQILRQCSNGLTRHYPVSQLEQALRAMPASQRQYTRCSDVIQHAITAGRRRSGGVGGGSGGSFLPTPVIVIIVLLILAAITFAAVAIRRRRSGGDEGPPEGGPA